MRLNRKLIREIKELARKNGELNMMCEMYSLMVEQINKKVEVLVKKNKSLCEFLKINNIEIDENGVITKYGEIKDDNI